MTQKEIDEILKNESGIILLKKESEQSFLESLFSSWISVFSALYFLTRKKMDTLILTENRIIFILRNKVYVERIFIEIESVNYNGNKSILEVIDQNQKFSFPLNKLRVSHEESKLIRQKLADYMNLQKQTE